MYVIVEYQCAFERFGVRFFFILMAKWYVICEKMKNCIGFLGCLEFAGEVDGYMCWLTVTIG